MPTRTDLITVAELLAAQARRELEPNEHSGTAAEVASGLARGAESALRAAALVDVEPAPIVAALERFGDRMEALHVQDWLQPADPVTALDDVAGWVEAWHQEVAVAAAVQHGYQALRDLLDGLLRDFSGSETDTARRIAARIQQGLDAAGEAIEATQRERTEG